MSKAFLDSDAVIVSEGILSEGYANPWEHYADELKRLDLKIQLQYILGQRIQSANPLEQFKGLVLSEEEIGRLLHEHPPVSESDSEISAMIEAIAATEEAIERKLEASQRNHVFLPLAHLADVFRLNPFEERCVLLAFAVEIEKKYEKLFAYLQDDITRKLPTVDLALMLFCASRQDRRRALLSLSRSGKLHKYILKKGHPDARETLLSRELILDERILNFLLHFSRADDGIARFAEIYAPEEELPPLVVHEEVQEQILKIASVRQADRSTYDHLLFYLKGAAGSGKKLQARHFCRSRNHSLMLVDLERMNAQEGPFSEWLDRVFREALIQQVVVGFSCFHALIGEEDAGRQKAKELVERIDAYGGLVFIFSDAAWKPTGKLHRMHLIDMELPVPNNRQRRKLWECYSLHLPMADGVDFGVVAETFRFTPGQIKDALATLESWSVRQLHLPDGKIRMQDIYKACNMQTSHNLEKKAKRIRPKYGWDDLILPEEQKKQLRNACNQMKYRHVVFDQWGFHRKLSYGKGLSMMFTGPPGTGKTMAAEVVASELYLEIYKIDLSQVISKYIGETEKNLHSIFLEAQQTNAILFFDESDALFGKRSEVKDAHDKYANIETSYLLQKMEEYEGISILASNFLQNIDEAFLRRFNYVIKFPFPDAEYREQIWRSMYPSETPLSPNVDFRFVAKQFQIAGGNIKNIVVSSAFLAAESNGPVSMKHILEATRHELKKSGKILLKDDLGEYSGILD